jgi:NADH-quinone oxidoreductase subunit K
MHAVPLSWYLTLSAVLFVLGAAGFLFRRNIITVFMSIELMLNAANLTFIAFSYQLKQVSGHIFTFFVMVVAAAEAAVGLAIILTVFKNRGTLNIDDLNSLRDGYWPTTEEEAASTARASAPQGAGQTQF